jgi:hypothetical protein
MRRYAVLRAFFTTASDAKAARGSANPATSENQTGHDYAEDFQKPNRLNAASPCLGPVAIACENNFKYPCIALLILAYACTVPQILLHSLSVHRLWGAHAPRVQRDVPSRPASETSANAFSNDHSLGLLPAALFPLSENMP